MRCALVLGVCIGWVLFGAAGVEAEATLARLKKLAAGEPATGTGYDALHASKMMLNRLVVPRSGKGPPLQPKGLWYTVAAVALGHWLAVRGVGKQVWRRLPAPAMGFGYAAMLMLTLVLAPDASQAFIYFQF